MPFVNEKGFRYHAGMVRAIVSAVLLVLLAVLVSFNLGFTATVSLFGVQFEQVPVMAIALLSFAVGVVYSLFLFIGRSLHARKKHGLAKKAGELAERERALEARQTESGAAPAEGASEETAQPEQKQRKSLLERLKTFF